MAKQIVVAIFLGIAASFALFGVGVYADELGYSALAKVVGWPNSLLQSLVPPHNIGTLQQPVLEGSPLNELAFLASVPLAGLLYAVVIYALRRRARGVP